MRTRPSRQRSAPSKPRDVLARERRPLPRVGACAPDEHAEQRGLAGAVGPDDADGLAGVTAKSTPSSTTSAPKRLSRPVGREEERVAASCSRRAPQPLNGTSFAATGTFGSVA